ncbi:uncharacterized protein LOC125209419 [Salvia hispanica]|uniref:uncharacterized protein LOC125209419 n=1 Tax=Salvia hispanica TaxID=49212 RepID=UPI00200952A0|nr:uncharacterized protein LOC125209419 [Salvia hispanica]XP_047964985.1 uncharacterized protein LOC125209419 [Salvia hispanica]XP_047964990.1 uncharacterized protein LOC125209419 [Salvia hispanica]XP_047964997.1 uncharacterized protein LOC125209419 [Salvia hispanica]XP_047965003.1 uncharacterized protein LOC125209419 [Salvia hispanica]XP_047965010.1 uncharacterized protein LOC125209419 [Salvia hispanica]
MELRSCSGKHFIQTIRGGLVIKVCNSNANGRTVARTKILNDVYVSEDAKRLQKPPSGSMLDYKPVKLERPCSMLATRTVCEIKSEPSDDAPSVDGDSDSDVSDAVTLSQLKNRLLTKRKKSIPTDEKPVEDGSDLNEPLINLKSKHLKATRAKRRRLNLSAISSATIKVAVKSEENLVSEGSKQAGGDLTPLIRVKLEAPDADQLGSHNEIPFASSTGQKEVVNPVQMTVLSEHDREVLSIANGYKECQTNEISYDHLEDIEPISIKNEGNVSLGTLESECKKSLGAALTEIAKPKENPDSCSPVAFFSDNTDADVSCHSSSSSVIEDMPDECSSSFQVPDMPIDHCITPPRGYNSVLFEGEADAHPLSELNDSLSSPGKNHGSKPGSIATSTTKENPISMDTVDEERLSTSSFDTVLRNDLDSEGQTEDELLKPLDKKNSEYSVTCTENEYSLDDRTCDNAETISKPEQHKFPERLFSTHKALSPSSQERLCLVMNSVEIGSDADQSINYGCKEKFFENQTGKKPSSLRLEVRDEKKNVNQRLPGRVSQRKFVICPRNIRKRSLIPKGNLEGPRFLRTLPNLSTGCTSVQGCSESAVAFSQRQMHDMESVALKLMNELKSMKDIVEQKLLFEAYRNASLKNDADEVKSAIDNAVKAEERAKKWMSMMARDCNRFCKIMKMTADSTPSSKDSFPKVERKIMFADEAGGKLCHVRFFNGSTASPASDAVEQ